MVSSIENFYWQESLWLQVVYQKHRITKNWENISQWGDTVVMGEYNLHFEKWNSETGLQKDLIEVVDERLTIKVLKQLVVGSTHFGHGRESLLYHCWLNWHRREMKREEDRREILSQFLMKL